MIYRFRLEPHKELSPARIAVILGLGASYEPTVHSIVSPPHIAHNIIRIAWSISIINISRMASI